MFDKKSLEAMTVVKLREVARKKKINLKGATKKADIVKIILSTLKEKGKIKVEKMPVRKLRAREKPTVKAKKIGVKKVKPVAKKVVTKRITAKKEEVAKRPEVEVEVLQPVVPRPKRIETEEERVEEVKYFEGVEVAYPAGEELPREYGDNRITLIARDPYCLFAYWEVTEERLNNLREDIGRDANLALRVYDVTGIEFDGRNANSFFDIGIYERVGNWYIHTDNPDHSFCVDIGLITPRGNFVTISRSNTVTTPRDRVSEVVDERWMVLEEEFEKIFALSGGFGAGLSSEEMKEIMKRRFVTEVFSET